MHMKTFVFFLFVLIISGCSNSEFSDIVNNSSNNTLSRSSSVPFAIQHHILTGNQTTILNF